MSATGLGAVHPLIAIIVLFSNCLVLPYVSAQDHLEPEVGALAEYDFDHDYHSAIRTHLLRSLDVNHGARMVCLPSFAPEWAVSLRRDDIRAAWFLELVVADKQLWGSKRPDDIKITKKTSSLDSATANVLRRLWSRALLEVKYNRRLNDGGVDGVTYHFSSSTPPRGILAGQCWSPDDVPLPNSKNNRIVEIGTIMRKYVEAVPDNKDDVKKLMNQRITELNTILDKG